MAFSQGSRSSLSYIVESTFGTTPAGNFTNLPFSTHSLNLTKDRVAGNDIQSDRMPRVDRHGNRQTSGDIVVDLSVFYRYNISNVLFQVERSTTANQGGALGVVANRLLVQSSVPGVLWIPESTYTEGDLGPVVNMVLRPEFNLEELQSTYKVLQVNAVGEGQINVCGENGNINAGDLIVCSSIAGKGMKQSDDIVRSISVAKARESVTFSSPTDIQQIACIYISG